MARREREKPGERGGARGISKDRDPQRQTKIMECAREPTLWKRKSGGASEERKRKRKRGRVRKRETRTETLQFAELLAEKAGDPSNDEWCGTFVYSNTCFYEESCMKC